MKKFILFFSILTLLSSGVAFSQCAMCRRVAETNYEQKAESERKGKSLNNGILYLLSIPYLIGGVGAVVWYKNRKKD